MAEFDPARGFIVLLFCGSHVGWALITWEYHYIRQISAYVLYNLCFEGFGQVLHGSEWNEMFAIVCFAMFRYVFLCFAVV